MPADDAARVLHDDAAYYAVKLFGSALVDDERYEAALDEARANPRPRCVYCGSAVCGNVGKPEALLLRAVYEARGGCPPVQLRGYA